MFKVTKRIDFCYGHRLLNYSGKCRHLHGHNGRIEIDITAETLDERGMVCDFGDIKKAVKNWLESTLDHSMLLNKADPFVLLLKQQNEPIYVMDENPTAENIAKLIYQFAKSRGWPVVEVRLWETARSFAAYRE